ncbi:leukemia inhibitory factor [Elgaria multicarinata webbii]|uniref:leukemia inhibitory factor n=1 Tax=Elgaria multicarinata webbii TaxID=159646 RepID=UPI002FCCF836
MNKPCENGVVPLLLATHCRLVSGRALLRNKRSPMCHNVRPCRDQVLDQIHCQVARLNMSAEELFEVYLKHQGHPFCHKELDRFCPPDQTFPSFDNKTSEEKDRLVSLYKIFIYFNTSLGNITRDQKVFGKDREEVLRQLSNTTNTTRGLLSNLTCLLCSKYKVKHVDVVYSNSSSTDKFLQKKQGCEELRRYKKVISQAAVSMGNCRRQL